MDYDYNGKPLCVEPAQNKHFVVTPFLNNSNKSLQKGKVSESTELTINYKSLSTIDSIDFGQ